MDNEIVLLNKPTPKGVLKAIAAERFGDLVKGVVDIEKKIMAVGADLHADEEAFLLEQGSRQENLWGITLYIDLEISNMLEFDSMINIRPRQNNRSRTVENEQVREEIKKIVLTLIHD